MTSKEALELMFRKSPRDISVISSLGRTAQEIYNLLPEQTLFLDAMGSVVPVGCGVALGISSKPVLAVDTDGSFLMGISVMSLIASLKEQLTNLCVVVLNNGILESAGGLQTIAVAPLWDKLGETWGINILQTDNLATLDHYSNGLYEGLTCLILHVDNQSDPAGDSTKTIDGIESKYIFSRHIEKVLGYKFILPARKN